ncbi:MAG: hypothetical protein M0Q53_00845 [Prolixibacteraceae bacterium]|nr:hypothetical protein [Prolixibacteraceae bacterium]
MRLLLRYLHYQTGLIRAISQHNLPVNYSESDISTSEKLLEHLINFAAFGLNINFSLSVDQILVVQEVELTLVFDLIQNLFEVDLTKVQFQSGPLGIGFIHGQSLNYSEEEEQRCPFHDR